MNSKEEAIRKINKIGKIAAILAKIAQVFIIIGIVCVTIATAVIFFLPKDLVTVKVNGSAEIHVNLEKFNVNFSEEDQKDIIESLSGTGSNKNSNYNFDFNGTNFNRIDNIAVDNNSIAFTAEGNMSKFNFGKLVFVCICGLLYLIMSLVTVIFIRRLAISIRDCASPFEATVIKRLEQLAFSLIPWVVLRGLAEGVMELVFGSNFNVNFNFNSIPVVTILLIIGLVYIFKYGAALQQESDETL